MKKLSPFFMTLLLLQVALSSCNGQTTTMQKEKTSKQFTEGKDFLVYERVRLMDNTGFTTPQEAYSILLPKGWKHESGIIWSNPGSGCDGTNHQLRASSADSNYQFMVYPDLVFGWVTNSQGMPMNSNQRSNSPYCGTGQPIQAEQYLRNVFARELGNPEVIEVTSNQGVIDDMRQSNEKNMRELQQYGAGQMRFDQTAINAKVRWANGNEGWVVLGITITEGIIPNVYNGTYDKVYTTLVTKRTVFTYPGAEAQKAKDQFSVIMSSWRTNPVWSNAVNKFWKETRQQSNIAHVGRIQLIDEQTRQIGKQAIRNGNERLKTMDVQMRNWEQQQSSQDRIHTEFIKTIREVENYQDASGKYEMSSGYSHAWSRGDGSSFVMSNNPNFDASSFFQDQNWKEMKRVR